MKKSTKNTNVEAEVVKTIEANKLLHKNMYDYGIDVIEDRALADFRDGLKPAQRRLLWTANDLKATWNNKTVKSARITGDCMGKYHPHGDSYGSLVTIATNEYPIIHGQGNWGSLTDGPAAARYTEAKISELGMKMLECNDVADMVPNYTGEFKEPIVIPTRFPNYFVNDCAGIAVGLSCNIPSHNLKEIVGALKEVIKKKDKCTVKDLVKHIKGPDYKYGGKILSDEEDIEELYANGEGKIKYECDYTLQKDGRHTLLTITGYCPGFSPNAFIEKMDKLIDDGVVIYVNDSSTKAEPCKLEVMLKYASSFEDYVHKHLIKSESYRFYAIERNKSEEADKDIDVGVMVPNMLELMQKWVDWRRDVEAKMTKREIALNNERKFKAELKLEASKHLDVIKKALEDDDTIGYLVENLPYLKKIAKTNLPLATKGATYIGEQKIISLRKIDQAKIADDIKELTDIIAALNKDLADIDVVVVRELDKLTKFFKPRALKV